jgi:hypothetical protein
LISIEKQMYKKTNKEIHKIIKIIKIYFSRSKMISPPLYNKTKIDLFYVKNIQFLSNFEKFTMIVETCNLKCKNQLQ